ncbi:MnmC family methyltransferase [Bdellovibrio svalbardensis]|uniref:MnmC family methyltransferase n=1 Tax=Bdellovibrio svalbardensis TaxID=2972972 RepID=A0ABT6DNB4_9BACT|nr:MnmC family methyltransferase [Bdellovibrio svalbardensis]MDG0816618.1 MnmC family methyltransferase [Bdellovibrio svalbardensis]
MKSWQDIGFEIEATMDGSPTLRLLESVDPTKFRGESMHHSGGACAETNLIYGLPMRDVLLKVTKPHFLVVGLGLGYIELTLAREALLAGKNSADVGLITSYESVPELREFFFAWLHDSEKLHPEVQKTYDQVLTFILADTDLKAEQMKAFLKNHFKKLEDLRGALSLDVVLESKYHCLLYDAFSSKTTPNLWEEAFLEKLLSYGVAEQSVMSTYACRASFRTALRNHGFEVIVREGFCGKRTSTLGLRNFSKM